MVVPVSTLVDSFDTTLDRTRWVSTSAAPNVYYDSVSQRAGIVCSGSFFTLGTDFANPNYSIQNSSIFCRWIPSTPAAGRESHFDLQTTGQAQVISFIVYGLNLIATTTPGPDLASVPYNPVTHAWLRLRHSGTTIFWETSPDGVTWNAFASTPFATNFTTDVWAVNFSCGGSPGGTDLFVDNVNVAPTGSGAALGGQSNGTSTATGTLSTVHTGASVSMGGTAPGTSTATGTLTTTHAGNPVPLAGASAGTSAASGVLGNLSSGGTTPPPPITTASGYRAFTLRRTVGGDTLRAGAPPISIGHKSAGFSMPLEQMQYNTDLFLDQQVALLTDLGVGWQRGDYPASLVSPSSGVYNYTAADKWVIKALQAGLQPLPVLYILPQWMCGSTNDKTPPSSNATFATWCATVCAHLYGLGVRYVEIWNEPNLSTFWNVASVTDANYRGAYASLMAAVYPAIKTVVPGMTVILGGLSTSDTVFQTLGTPNPPGKGALSTFERYGQLGVYANCDAVAWHPYLDSDLPCVDVGGWPAMNLASAQAVLAILDNYAPGRNLRLWTTETGAPRSVTGTQDEQARRAHDVFNTVQPSGCMATIAARMGPIFWFCVIDRSLGGAREQSFGFVSPDQSTQYIAYGTMRTYWATPSSDTVAVGGVQAALRYGPQTVSFDVVKGTTLTGRPFGYDSTYLTISIPATVPWNEAVLVRGAFGYPTTPLDGVAVWYEDNQGLTSQFNVVEVDQPVTGGYRYYYSLFLGIGTPDSWLNAAQCEVLVPRNYGHATKLFEMLPSFYQRTDSQQAADGRNGPLRKFTAILGYDADYNRTLLDGVLNVYDPDLAPLQFVEYLGTNLGLPIEQALGGARYRTLVGSLWNLEGLRGTSLGLQAFVYASSNYECQVQTGKNMLLTPDDSEFINGIGHWQMFLNPIVTTFQNYFSHLTPAVPGDAYAAVVIRPYAGTDIPRVSGAGQGILEITEGAAAVAGAPGTITGATFANLLALQHANPPCGAVPSTPWFTDQYVVLNDSSHAAWNGTVWVAGNGPATRPAAARYMAGTPGLILPTGALAPANFAAIPFINSDGVSPPQPVPPVGWKTGDYILLGDGSHAYLQQNGPTSSPSLQWAVGNGTLPTTPVTTAIMIPGKTGVWYAGATPVAAPASLAALKAITPMPIPSGLPWTPTQSFMWTYDNTKVSIVGTKRSGNVTSGTYYVVSRYEPTPTLNTQTDTAWTEVTRLAGDAANAAYLMGATKVSGSFYDAISMPSGWSRIPFPTASVTGSFTDVGGTHTTVQSSVDVTMQVDAMVVAYPPTGNTGTSSIPPLPDGAKIAIRVNGVEICHVGVGGSEIYASGVVSIFLLADVFCPAGQPVELWFFNPGGAAMNIGSQNYSRTTFPYLRVTPLVALPEDTTTGDYGGQMWQCPATDKYYIHGHIEYGSSLPPLWYIWVNQKQVALGTWSSDGVQMDVSWSGVVNAGETVYWGSFYGYAPQGQRINRIAGTSPKLEIYRWAAV